ncbi:hypothetical protein [Paraburkholderia unamae]|uniref:Apea-like HEPN domain-containing protein n=1 Tax=Paraburkholderia unamae TaxID=219649 RepID=A0ABX5KV11_9BURK|nr:hypothetical protein [Paraburkholderia unamae]PVX85850.1 hypothetical protein C7402_103428 [Paraburkholderia unamae]
MADIQIEVKLTSSGPTKLLFDGAVQTRSSTNQTDQVQITNRKITANLQRSSVQSAPLAAHNSTFFKLIIKSLALYYTLARKPARIRTICWRKIAASGATTEFPVEKSEIVQIVGRKTDLSLLTQIVQAKAELLMEETDRGRAVLYAITHLIKALDSDGPFERFDRLWRAFNALYKAFSGKTKDTDCHIDLANDIRANPIRYPLSVAKVTPLTKDEIRKHTRWNLMLQNNYPTPKRTKNLRDAIVRTADSRIIEIYRDTLSIRETLLKAEGGYNAASTHIGAMLATPQVNHSDVVTTLCIKYMYFVRNKIAHAERTDSGFAFLRGSAEEAEISWLTPMLEALIIDLINISDTF